MLNRRLFSKCMLTCGMYDDQTKNTPKDNLSVSSLRCLLFHDTQIPAAVKSWKWKYSIKGKQSKDRVLSSTSTNFIFFTVTYELTEIWQFSRETSRSIHKSTQKRVDWLKKLMEMEAPFEGLLQSVNLFKPAGYFSYYWNPWVTLYNMVISLSNTLCWSQRCLPTKSSL